MGEEEEEHRFLGCHYSSFECKAGVVEDLLKQHPSYHRRPHLTKEDCNGEVPHWTIDRERIVKGKMYDMSDFVDQCVDTFWALGNIHKSSIRPVKTLLSMCQKTPVIGSSRSKRTVKLKMPQTTVIGL